MDIFDKYKLRIINNKRYYEFGFSAKIYSYELTHAIPYLFKYKDITIQTSGWSQLAIKILTYLYEKNPKTEDELLSLKYDFSNAPVFSKEKRVNFSSFRNLYLNTNHSAGHAYRSIQMLLLFFGVDLSECYFLIKRHMVSEPDEIKTYYKNITLNHYTEFLKYKGVGEDKIPLLIKNIESLNTYLNNISSSYNDFFLFDDYAYFINYKIRLLKYLNKKKSTNKKLYDSSKVSLKYLDMFYKHSNIFEKINKGNIKVIKEKLVVETNRLFEELGSNVISSHMLYDVMKVKHNEEMNLLGELNNKNDFFHICEVLLDKEYVLSRPFISKAKNISLSNNQLLLRYAYSQEKVTVYMLGEYADKMHFKRIDYLLKFFTEISDQFIQVNVDTLVDKDTLNISDDFLKELKKELQFLIENFGPINTQELKGYHLLPSIDLEWNKYLLVGLIKTFLSESFKIDYTDRFYNKTDFIIDIV